MSNRTVLEWLGDIVSWGERLQGHIAGMNYESFVRDPKTQGAASKCIESIGLAANEANKRVGHNSAAYCADWCAQLAEYLCFCGLRAENVISPGSASIE
jgi:hypothetical protein